LVPEETMNWNENRVSIGLLTMTVLALYGIVVDGGGDCTHD